MIEKYPASLRTEFRVGTFPWPLFSCFTKYKVTDFFQSVFFILIETANCFWYVNVFSITRNNNHGQRVLTHFPLFHVIFWLEFTCSQRYIFITKHRLTKVPPWSKFLVEVDAYECLTSNTQHCAWGKGNWSSPFVGVANSQATASREIKEDATATKIWII